MNHIKFLSVLFAALLGSGCSGQSEPPWTESYPPLTSYLKESTREQRKEISEPFYWSKQFCNMIVEKGVLSADRCDKYFYSKIRYFYAMEKSAHDNYKDLDFRNYYGYKVCKNSEFYYGQRSFGAFFCVTDTKKTKTVYKYILQFVNLINGEFVIDWTGVDPVTLEPLKPDLDTFLNKIYNPPLTIISK